jgi:DNA-binding CsgD family transcriptional regulator
MSDTEQLSALIGSIYDAALDRSLWVDVLRKSTRFVGGQAAGLLSKDAVSKSANLHYGFGVDPHYDELYLERYAKLEPTAMTLLFFDIGQVLSTTDFMLYDEFLATRYYKEWAKPQGWVDCVHAILDKSATSSAHVSILRNESSGVADDATRARMQLIVPHLRRAVLIGKVIDLKTAESDSLADSVDGISAAMFLVDGSARIVHANASGHAMLAQGSVLRAVGGKLLTKDASAEQALNEVCAMAERGDAAVGAKGIAIPLTAIEGTRYVAHVLPLTSGARRRAGATYAAAAAVFVHKAALDAPSSQEVIGKLYKLTPTELRVLVAIMQVGGVSEVAEALGIAESTVRTHLLRLFAKTGAKRQSDLIKLVASYTNPLIN